MHISLSFHRSGFFQARHIYFKDTKIVGIARMIFLLAFITHAGQRYQRVYLFEHILGGSNSFLISIHSNKNRRSCSTLLQLTAETIKNQEKCSVSGKHVRQVNRCWTVLIIRTSRVKIDFRSANLSTWISLFILVSITAFAFVGVDASDRSIMKSNQLQGRRSVERNFSTD